MHQFMRYFLFNKPYRVLSQFTGEGEKQTLADFLKLPKDVYPVGRLDYDSEGLLLLTNDNHFKSQLLDPEHAHEKEYWAQVEGNITGAALQQLESGVSVKIKGNAYQTRPAKVRRIYPDHIAERDPPIRYRKNIPDSWLSICLTEGKNRQVRKMTAAAGFPTLRLIRYRIGRITISHLPPGQVIELTYPKVLAALQSQP